MAALLNSSNKTPGPTSRGSGCWTSSLKANAFLRLANETQANERLANERKKNSNEQKEAETG